MHDLLHSHTDADTSLGLNPMIQGYENPTGLTRIPPAVEPTALLDSTVPASISSRACSPRRITSESLLVAVAGAGLGGSDLSPDPLTGAACRASTEACGGSPGLESLALRV